MRTKPFAVILFVSLILLTPVAIAPGPAVVGAHNDNARMDATEATKDFDDPVNITTNPVSPGAQSVIVTVKDGGIGVPEATVRLEKGAEVFSVGITNASGYVSFNINPATPGWLYATVSKHNYTVWQGNPEQLPAVEAWQQY